MEECITFNKEEFRVERLKELMEIIDAYALDYCGMRKASYVADHWLTFRTYFEKFVYDYVRIVDTGGLPE